MTLLPVEYSESFAEAIATALGSDVQFICNEIQQGVCQAWVFSCDGETLGHAVTRLENDCLVVVAYEGTHVAIFGDLIVRICEAKRLPCARFHTQRPGLIKLLSALNPEPLEYVVKVECYGR